MLRSTIIWCSQRFLWVLELICLFTKMCSHSRPKKEVYDERHNDLCATPTSCRWFGFFLVFCHDISALFTRSTILNDVNEKEERSDRMLVERQNILHSDTTMVMMIWVLVWWHLTFYWDFTRQQAHTNHFLVRSIPNSSMCVFSFAVPIWVVCLRVITHTVFNKSDARSQVVCM